MSDHTLCSSMVRYYEFTSDLLVKRTLKLYAEEITSLTRFRIWRCDSRLISVVEKSWEPNTEDEPVQAATNLDPGVLLTRDTLCSEF